MSTQPSKTFTITVADNQIRWQIRGYEIIECIAVLEQVKFKLLEQHSAAEAKAAAAAATRPTHLTGLPGGVSGSEH